MSTLLRRAGLLVALLSVATFVQAQSYTHQVFLDRDQDPATGCDVASAAGTIPGAEARLTATISDYPAGVASLVLASCEGAGFGADSALEGAYPVGYDLGAGGSDVIEFAVTLAALGGGPNTDDWTLWFLSTGLDTGAADLVGPVTAQGLGAPPQPPPNPAPVVIPLLDPWALLLLSLALGVGVAWAARRYRGLLPVLLVGAALSVTGIAWAANYLLDGNVGDWDQPALDTDPADDAAGGSPPGTDPGADLRAVYAARENGRIFFRSDVAEAQIERLITGLLSTTFQADENPANGATVGELRAVTTGLGSLLQFTLSSQLPAGAFAVDADGTITAADGSLVDFEANTSHALDVQVSINGVAALTIQVAVTITVNDLNEAPAIAAQAFAVDESAAAATVVGTVVATDPDNDTLTYTLDAADNTGGAFALDGATGTLTVATPAAVVPANSPFLLDVTASDGTLSSTAVVTVTVNDLNFPPETSAGAAAYATDEDAALVEAAPGLLAGFTDPDGDTLSVVTTPVSGPASGTLALATDGSFTYTPNADVNGADTFTYTVSDGNGGTLDRVVNLTINPLADAPVGVADAFTVAEGATLAPAAPGVLGNDTDAENDALTAVLDAAPAHASSFSLNADGSFSYTHDGGEETSDSFSYHANDGGLDSAVTTVTLTITGENDLPVAVDDAYTFAEGGTLTAIPPGVLGNDTDAEGDALSAVLVSGPANASAFTFNADGSFDYTHDGSETTSDSFTYTANDAGVSNTATVSLTITPVNDAPVANDDTYALDEGTSLNVAALVGVLGNDTDTESDPLTAALVAGPANAASFTLNADGSFSYTHDGSETTADSFTYTANDADPSNTATVTITVNPVNDAPVAVADSSSVDEDQVLSVAAPGVLGNDTDAEGDTLTAVLDAGPSSALSFTLNPDGSYSYTPAADFSGSDSFSYHATDGSADSGTVVVSITVNAVNDLPVANADAFGVNESETLAVAASGVLGNDTDAENDSLSAVLVSGPAHASAFTLNPDGSFSYTHDGSETPASDSFTYTANDAGSSNVATVTISITAVNDAPLAADDGYAVDEGATLNIAAPGVLANDSDAEGNAFTAALVSGPANASAFALNADGSFSYTHDGSETTSDSFTYTASDADTSNTATVTIAVNPVNDAPVAAADSAAVDEDQTLSVAAPGVLGNDTDAEGDTLSAVLDAGPTNAASFTLNADGSYSYTPAPNFNGSDGFSYHAFDGTAGSTTVAVTVTVNPVDDPPVAVADAATLLEDASATTIPVLGNDTDIDGGLLNVVSATDPANGTAMVAGDSLSVAYTPDANYCNSADGSPSATPDSFDYTLNGGSSATVSVTVTCVNDAPTLASATIAYATAGNTQLHVDGATLAGLVSIADAGDALAKSAPSDIDGPGPFTVVPFSGASANGGDVALAADGTFTYVPPAGFSGTDTVAFQVSDSGAPAAFANGTIQVTVSEVVWYVRDVVDANNAAGGDGRSSNAFETLAAAQAASGANHQIFVFRGNTGTTPLGGGITLKNGQKLHGEGIGLVHPTHGALLAPGMQPHITNGAGNGVTVLADTANGDRTGIEIRGLQISGSANGIDVTSANAANLGLRISDNHISAAGAEGIDVNIGSTSATQALAIHDNLLTATGTALDISRTAGTATITAFDDNVVSGASAGTGISVTGPNLVFDAVAGGSFNTVAGNVLEIGGAGAGGGVGGAGMVLNGVSGDLSFASVDVYADSGAALQVTGTGTYTGSAGLRLRHLAPGTGTLVATGGPAASLSTLTADLRPATITSASSPSNGVSLVNLIDGGGTNAMFSAGAGSTISNAAGTAFNIDGGNPTVSYGGTITNSAGRSVVAQNRTGDSATFTGSVGDTGTGVLINANAVGVSTSFQGGLSLSTGANAAFTATSGGTIEVCDESPCNAAATGALVNTLTTTTGTALNVTSTTIGANDLEFRSISANGAVNGIVLNTTGALGGLVVKGTGAAASGGTIQNTASHGVSLASTTEPAFNNMAIANSGGSGVNGTLVAGFTFTNGSINNSGTAGATDDSNIAFNDSSTAANVSGTITITGNSLTNARFHGVDIQHYAGTISHANISSNTLTSAASVATSLGSAIRLDAYGTPTAVGHVMRATIANNVITNFPTGAGIHAFGGNQGGTAPTGTFGVPGSATDIIAIVGNRMDGGALGVGNQPDRFFTGGVNGNGQGNFDISDNGTSGDPIRNIDGVVIELNQFGTGSMSAMVDNNFIDANNAVGSSGINVGCDADGSAAADNALVTATISNNNVQDTDGPGIFPIARGSSCSLTVRVLNNTVAAPDTTSSARAGIRVDSGSAVGATTLCLELSGNTTGGSTNSGTMTTSPGINLRKQGTDPAINVFGIEGLSPSPAGTPNVENHVNGQNTSSSGTFGVGGTALLSAQTGFTGCTAP